jgi:hypothetical protein
LIPRLSIFDSKAVDLHTVDLHNLTVSACLYIIMKGLFSRY